MKRLCATVLALCISGTVLGAVPEAGLKAWYAFDEGAGNVLHDRSGNKNHGKIVGATWVRGNKGSALYFSDSAERVICGMNPVLDYSKGLTMTIWAKPAMTDSVRYLASFSAFNVYRTDGRLVFESRPGPDAKRKWDEITTRHKMAEGQWGFVAIVYDAERRTKEIYVNGELSGSLEGCGLTRLIVDELSIGGYVRCRQDFVGMLGDLRVYERGLTGEEIKSLYQAGLKRMDDSISAAQVPLTVDVSASPERQLVAAVLDTVVLGDRAENASAEVGLYKRGTARPVRERRFSALAVSGLTRALFSTDDLAAGEYEIRTVVKSPQGGLLRPVSVVPVTLKPSPSWLQPEKGVKVLNNLVIQLLLRDSVRPVAHTEYGFHNPREGWIFIRIDGALKEGRSVAVSLDAGSAANAVLTRDHRTRGPSETMRWLGKGDHVLHLWCRGRPQLKNLVVRAVPVLAYHQLGKPHALAGYVDMEWDFIKREVVPNINTITHNKRGELKDARIREWLRNGGHRLMETGFPRKPNMTAQDVHKYWAVGYEFRNPGLDGALISEFNVKLAKYCPAYTDAVKLVKADKTLAGRKLLPYMSIDYPFRQGREFLRVILENGYVYAAQLYLKSPGTEAAADRMIYGQFKRRFMRWESMLPGTVRQTLMVPAYFSGPPEGCDVSRVASFRTFLDKEMNLLANDPLFFGTYGVMWYTARWADEENVRWGGRLYRHYCIEGRTEPLGKDPYELTHIVNPDFAEGTEPWELQSAEKGSMTIEKLPGIYWLQGRYHGHTQRDTVLRTKRNAARPNVLSQQIKDLHPGRVYSLKMFTADYNDMKDGKSDKKTIAFSLKLEGVDVLPGRGGDYVYTGSRWHRARGFDGKNKCWSNYHVRLFRARATFARLVISDWNDDKAPGSSAPAGQELIFSGMRVEPYLEE